ncbi:MAG: serine/threonine-protein phosphatase [Candidatus Riflebacteria bacterium]|nr:serine/threonine-protein phosphatase [Candidatus Riflebacteria bacterium]
MRENHKQENPLKLRLIKISLGLLIVSFLVLVRELGWHDIGVWPAAISLTILLANTVTIVYLATHSPTPQNRQPESASLSGTELSTDQTAGAGTEIDATSIHYLLHFAETDSALNKRINRALCMLPELMPDKIFVLFSVTEGHLEYAGGARLNSRNKSETIEAADNLIDELTSRINNCVDSHTLRHSDKFLKPLSFSRNENIEDGLLLPVAHNDKLFAIMAVIATASNKFDKSEIDLLRHFCCSMAILLNNQRISGEFSDAYQVAAENQLTHKLFAEQLPTAAVSIPGWDIAQLAGYSSEHSGDFHDYISLPGNRMLIIVGKTSGKGLKAALYLTRLRTMLSCLCETCSSPAELLNNLSVRLTGEKSLDLFASLIVLQVRANDRNLTLAVAGHAMPLINRPRSGYVEIAQLAGGVPLGLFNQGVEPYQNQVIQLLPGDGILIYTDGAIDFSGSQGSRFGSEDLKVLLDKMPEQYADDLLANLADQLIPDKFREKPLEDYTFIYASTE